MKVLMQGRYELLDKGGGDKIQVLNTAEELRKLGVEVDIVAGPVEDLSKYDLVHLFQMDWTPETYFLAKNIKHAGKPFVFSPIHHNVKEVKRFDDEFAFDFRRLSKILFSEQHQRDTFKNVYRSVFNPKKLPPTLKSIIIGLKKMHTESLKMADIVLVQTKLEARDLLETYKVDFSWKLVHNGVGKQFLEQRDYKNPFNFENYLLCVGRIEPRKNQLNVIKAVKAFREKNNLDSKLVFIGKSAGEKHFEYKRLFTKALKENNWVVHLDSVPYEEMPAYYRFAKVAVSASWFESTGLTGLEAIISGTNTVAAGERAKEYLGDLASYCDPGDVGSITSAVEKEYFAPRPQAPSDMIFKYTWENAARETLEVYNDILLRFKK